jgi:hypothetical protein
MTTTGTGTAPSGEDAGEGGSRGDAGLDDGSLACS